MSIGVNRTMIGDDDVLFEPTSWHIKIDFIHQFILNNNVLISVLGEKGTGKSTFARLLRDTLTANIHTVLLTATPLFETIPFIEQICLQLGLETELSFSDIVTEINKRQARTLMIIDNAEELPETFVTEILDALMQQEGSGYCHVCILSDFSLVKMTSRLARETYRDMIHSIELQPLNQAEANAYVSTRMAALNANQIELSDECLQQFYELTGGNIMGINTQMMGFFSNKSVKNTPLYKRYLPYGYIPVLAIAMIGVVYFISSQSPSDAPELTKLVQNTMQSVELELPLSSEIPFYDIASVHQPMELVSLQKVDIQMANEDADAHPDESLVVMDKVVTIPKVEMNQPVDLAEEAKAAPKVTVVKKLMSQHTAVKKTSKQQNLPKTTVVHAHSKSASPSGRFTIQLMATRDKSELNRLSKQYRAADGFNIRRFDNQGVVWFVLTRGDYAQKQLAQHALLTLPKHLAQLKPWVRSTAHLKNLG